MHQFLREAIAKTIQELYQQSIGQASIQLNHTPAEYVGDCTIVVFPFTRFSKLAPEATAQQIGSALAASQKSILSFNVIKGFLNIVFTDEYWCTEFNQHQLSSTWGQLAPTGKKIMVEYSSPNTNKPLHLGHVRNNLLGFSVSEILKAAGNEVVKTNLVNDRGVHICKSMLAWQLFGNGETPESSGIKGDHLVGKYYVIFDKKYKEEIKTLMEAGKTEEEAKKEAPLMLATQDMLRKWEAADTSVMELWKKMNEWVYAGFATTYQRMGVDFDTIYYESNTYLLGKSIVQEGLAKEVFYQLPDASVWIDLESDGLDKKIVQRSDGTSVYITQDIGTAQMKYDQYQMDTSIYVVGNEQDYHFKVLQLIIQKLKKPYADGIYHMSYGMVELPDGKMKSREGTVVDADNLMDEMIETAKEMTVSSGKIEHFSEAEKIALFDTIGLGALKFFLLKVDPKKKMLFNPAESIDLHGFTGPYIQYCYARIQSLLKKLTEQDYAISDLTLNTKHPLASEEKALLQQLLQLEIKIQEAATALNPAIIANYAYQVAKTYNHFYQELTVVNAGAEEKAFRVLLTKNTARIIEQTMKLLGIRVPNRM